MDELNKDRGDNRGPINMKKSAYWTRQLGVAVLSFKHIEADTFLKEKWPRLRDHSSYIFLSIMGFFIMWW
jgi:hypothetical protein